MPGGLTVSRPASVTLGDWCGALAWSPDGGRLAAGSLAGDAVIVDGVDGALVAKLADHPFGVGRVAWSPDGTRLAIGGQDGIVRLYDRDATILGEHDAGLGGWVGALAWSPSGVVSPSAPAGPSPSSSPTALSCTAIPTRSRQ